MRYAFSLLFILFLGQCAVLGANVFSRSDGTWSNTNGGPDCSCTPTSNDDIFVNHDIFIVGDFSISGSGSLTVNSPALFTVTGNLTFNSSSSVIVNVGAELKVLLNFLNENGSNNVTIAGTLTVDGNFTNGTGLGTDAVIDVGATGTISYSGTCSNPGTVTNDTDSYRACNNEILPIELLYFTVKSRSNITQLEWATLTEINSDHFIIERSYNGIDFDSIGFHSAAGDSHQTVNYSWSHTTVGTGRSYYRLKAVDRDGTYEYFVVTAIVSTLSNDFEVSPNPVRGSYFDIKKQNRVEGERMFLYDTTGKLLREIRINNDVTRVELVFPLPPGIYLLRSEDNGMKSPARIVVQ